MRKVLASLVFLLLSWLAAVALPKMDSVFSLAKVAFSYGTFLYALSYFRYKFQKILVAIFWATTLTMWNLAWLNSDVYIGECIHYVWFFLSLLIGIQFTVFTLMFFKIESNFSKKFVFFLLPLSWVFIENLRYKYLLCGYSWDLIGIALSYHKYSSLFAGFLGVSGLSLWTLVIAISWFYCMKIASWKNFFIWCFCFIFPFLLGSSIYHYHDKKKQISQEFLSIALVQPNFIPLNQGPIFKKVVARWEQLVYLLSSVQQKVNLIVFPETIFPYGASTKFFSSEKLNEIFFKYLNITPFVDGSKFSHLDIFTELAHYFKADILVGLERRIFSKEMKRKSYNSAFLIARSGSISFYDKRLLVPIGEYFPGGSLGYKIGSKFFGNYVITPGKDAIPLIGECTPKFGVSICYEETFSYILQKYKKQKAQFLVNLTNDVWYPRSTLPYDHFIHGRLRGLELGLPYVRVCNTGITGAWDSLGNTINFLPYESKKSRAKEGVIVLNLPLYSYATFYSLIGDSLLNYLSWIAIFLTGSLISFNQRRQS